MIEEELRPIPALVQKPPSVALGFNFKQLGTVIGVTVILVIGALYIFRPGDPTNDDVATKLIAFAGILLTFLKTQETHLTVNSRMTEFLEASKMVNYAEGRRQATVAAAEKATQVALEEREKATKLAADLILEQARVKALVEVVPPHIAEKVVGKL